MEYSVRFYSGVWTLYAPQRDSGLSRELPVAVLDLSLITGVLVHSNNGSLWGNTHKA